ncbi:MAG TPA: hypothetical protein VGJ84_13790 [Polyangiaceae bacterium]
MKTSSRSGSTGRRGICAAVAALVVLIAVPARAGSYLDRIALLLQEGAQEAELLRAHPNDAELAQMVHRMTQARLKAAELTSVPKEVVQAHPHLLLVLTNYERAADASENRETQRLLVYLERARDEERTLRSVLKQLGFPLPH